MWPNLDSEDVVLFVRPYQPRTVTETSSRKCIVEKSEAHVRAQCVQWATKKPSGKENALTHANLGTRVLACLANCGICASRQSLSSHGHTYRSVVSVGRRPSQASGAHLPEEAWWMTAGGQEVAMQARQACLDWRRCKWGCRPPRRPFGTVGNPSICWSRCLFDNLDI